MSAFGYAPRDATGATRRGSALLYARARARRGVRGVASVASVAYTYARTEGDWMRRGLLVVVGGTVLMCTYGFGAFQGSSAGATVTVVGWALVAGGVLGGLVAAGHVRERRAFRDWRDARAVTRRRRSGWFEALGVSGRRLALLAVLAGGALWYLRGRP